MRKCIGTVFIVLALGIMASGCVSNGTYREMEMGKNQEIDTLKGKVAALQDRVVVLEKQQVSMAAENQQTEKEYTALLTGLSKEMKSNKLKVKQYQNMVSMDLAEQLFFASGSATLKPDGKEILKDVADALKAYEDKIIRVVGHTDNVPIATSMYPSNWELSVARAAAVVRYLQEAGIPPERMIAAGRGEYSPLVPNDTPEDREINRRIEIMLIDKSLAEEMAKHTM